MAALMEHEGPGGVHPVGMRCVISKPVVQVFVATIEPAEIVDLGEALRGPLGHRWTTRRS